jgi:hypothetical protein
MALVDVQRKYIQICIGDRKPSINFLKALLPVLLIFGRMSHAQETCIDKTKTFTSDSAKALYRAFALSDATSTECGTWCTTYSLSQLSCDTGYAYADEIERSSCTPIAGGRAAALNFVEALRSVGASGNAGMSHQHFRVSNIRCTAKADPNAEFECELTTKWLENCDN